MRTVDYVNIFHGNGEYSLPTPQGIAAKWYFLKAGTGNTSPAATLPFGAISVGPFSGGYPTGYGNYLKNTHSLPAKFDDGDKLLGFSHLHQSGTGSIGFYYNYAVTTPYYKDATQRQAILKEGGSPGYYFCELKDIKCELTATHFAALHRYSFSQPGAHLRIDFSNNGLTVPDDKEHTVNNLKFEMINQNTVCADCEIEGIKVFFAAWLSSSITKIDSGCVYSEGDDSCIEVKLAISIRSKTQALSYLEGLPCFDTAKGQAEEAWLKELDKIKLEADERTLGIFYSNLYHSLVKPCSRKNESPIYAQEDYVTDFATLWDTYKTALPLIFMINGNMAKEIANTLIYSAHALGFIPNSMGLSSDYLLHSGQVKAIGVYVLLTAYIFGADIDKTALCKAIDIDLFCDGSIFKLMQGEFQSATWLLDVGDACLLALKFAKEMGDDELVSKLQPFTQLWQNAYAENGLLRSDSDYYEGSLYNYSFRQMVKMDERIAMAGGKESFAALLDSFFGYGKEDVVRPTDPNNPMLVYENYKLGRFEGFNNEPDMEAPYSYIFADSHYRLCEVIRSGMKFMFSDGRGGLPGNNDSGALSSYYVLSALGIFPVAGQDLVLFGSPIINRAKILLSSNKELEIIAHNNSDSNIYVDKICFNGKLIKDFRSTITLLMQGGRLEFFMKEMY